MKGWEVKKLADVCLVIAGQSPEGKYYNDKGIGLPFYQGKKEFTEKNIGEPTTWTSVITKEAEKGDILMSVRAPVGPVNFCTKKICIGRGLAAIRAGKSVDKDYIFNFLVKHESEIVGNIGAVFNSINKTQIENIPIPLPPQPEQKRIVAILDEAFAAIDKAKANTEKNLQNAKELFQSELNNIFTNKGKGWEEKKLGEVISYDKTPHKTSNLPYVGLENIESNSGRFLGSLDAQQVKSTTFHFTKDHILYGRLRPYLNKVLLPNFEGHCSTEIFPILVGKELEKKFLYYWLISKKTVERIDSTWTGARMPRANMNAVLNFYFKFPVLKEQKRIIHQLDTLSTETKKLEALYQQKLNALDELKKSILQKAFSGELPGTALRRLEPPLAKSLVKKV